MIQRFAVCVLLFTSALGAQQDPPTRQEAAALMDEIVDLMDASAIVVPEMARAGAPLAENVRQSIRTLEVSPGREHVGVIYSLLTNARVYLQLLDALPKPPAFSADVRAQVESMRTKVDSIELYFRTLLDRRELQLRAPDRDNLARYADDNDRRGQAPPGAERVVFLGDSITDGWQINQYFPGKDFINRGIGGQITSQMLGRLQADVIALQPKAVLLLGGTNDLARGVSVDAIKNNIEMIARLAEAHGIRPILGSILPVSDHHADKDPRFKRTPARRPNLITELNIWMRGLCQKRGYRYLDYFLALADDQGRLSAALADDGLHPNAEGYKLMAPLAQKAIEETLAASRTPKKAKRRFGVF